MLSKMIMLTFLLATSFFIDDVSARCNTCNDNGIACISETSFNLCYNGERDTTQRFDCPPGTICTSLALRCADRSSSAQPQCASKGCGQCDGDKMFTCTSRTTFVQCNGTELLSATAGSCPKGLTCDSNQSEICVSECRLSETLECSNDVA